MGDYKVISADSHAEEPTEIYEVLPAEYKDRAPRMEIINGRRYLVIDGQRPIPQDAPHALTEDDRRKGYREGDETPHMDRGGGTNVSLRLTDLDEDGVRGEVIYTEGMFEIHSSPDPKLQLALSRVVNDWVAEVFGGHPDRFVPSATIPVVDINDAVAESKRVAKLGYRSISVPVSKLNHPYNQPEYEPLWSTMEELKIPLSFHVFTSGAPAEGDLYDNLGKELLYGETLIFMGLGVAEAMDPLVRLIASGVLDRHPDFKFVLVECGIGWLAWYLNILDELAHKRHQWMIPQLKMLPSEYFKRQGHITFGDDAVGLNNRHFTGVDCLMWGSDYPHEEGTFPHSRQVIDRTFQDLTEDEKRKIVLENAAKLYGFPLN